MRAAFCVFLLLAPQDTGSRVRELLERMQEDDIDVADQAGAELLKLGPPALPFLRDAIKDREGDLRLRVEDIVRKIERNEKVRRAVGDAPLVTLRLKDRPLSEILAEISRQSGVPIEGRGLPAGARASLEADNVVVWKAIDELCRGHGGIMYALTPRRILVKAMPYRDLPRVFDRGFFFFFDSLQWSKYFNAGAAHSYFFLQAGVAWPPAVQPLSAAIDVERMEDDRKTDLLQKPGGAGMSWSSGNPSPAPQEEGTILLPLSFRPPTPPADEAAALAVVRGRILLKFALETRRTLSIADPLAQQHATEKSGKTTLQMRSWKRKGGTLRIEVALTSFHRPSERVFYYHEGTTGRLSLTDKAGKRYSGKSESLGSSSSGGSEGYTVTQTFAMNFQVPEGTEIASLDLLEPTETEELFIPFEFKGVPLK